MRNLSAGNKMNFTLFAFIILAILIILVIGVFIAIKNGKDEYEISMTEFIYDKEYNYIQLQNEGKVTKKWNGNYYLKENISKNEYDLGKYAVSFDSLKRNVGLFGTYYQVMRNGDIAKLTDYNVVNNTSESKFYKIDDRKYLIIANNIENDTGSLFTEDYLIVIIDKLGNALLLNNKMNLKTINKMVISTDDYDFDVANEVLMYENESINLKKIIGSTNQYVPIEVSKEDEEKDENQNNITENNTTNNNTTIQGPTKVDTSWVDGLNKWISDVASAFTSIYNGSNNKKEETKLVKSIALNRLSSGVTYIDIDYSVVDPEDKYNVVYAIVYNESENYSISLDKNAKTYRVTDLKPNTNYVVKIGYKIIHSDAKVEEKIEDTMTVRTTLPAENLSITKVSLDKIYYTLKLDSNFVYEPGATLVVYVNNDAEYSAIELKAEDLEKAASTGYFGSFKIPDEYKKTLGAYIKIKLENTKYNNEIVDNNLMYKIINY